MKDAVKTSVLSKNWCNSWAFSPNIDFPFPSNQYHGNKEVSAIDRCISFYKKNTLHRLHIDLNFWFDSYTYVHYCYLAKKRVENWLEFAAKRKVEQLNVIVNFDHPVYFVVPQSLFCTSSIQFLRLKSCLFSPPSNFKGFPVLKNLYLNCVQLVDVNLVQSLLFCCPCLQALEILDCKDVKHLKISNTSSLRRLTVSKFDKVKILEAPSLRFFRCYGDIGSLILKTAPSLVTLDMSSVTITDWRACVIDLSHVKFLSANPYLVQLISANHYYFNRKERVLFKNIKKFNLDGKICVDVFTLYSLLKFLQDCPSLENLVIDLRLPFPPRDDNWIGEYMENERSGGRFRLEFGGSLLYNLTSIRVNGFSKGVREMTLVQILLDRAVNLEKFFLHSLLGEKTREAKVLQDELSSLNKRSRDVKIVVENGLRLDI